VLLGGRRSCRGLETMLFSIIFWDSLILKFNNNNSNNSNNNNNDNELIIIVVIITIIMRVTLPLSHGLGLESHLSFRDLHWFACEARVLGGEQIYRRLI